MVMNFIAPKLSVEIVVGQGPTCFLFFKLFGKIDFRFSDPQKPEKSICVLKPFGKIDFHYAGEVTHPTSYSGLP